MEKTSIESIVKATKGVLVKRGSENYITGVKHDSRDCEAGDLFVAVIGENQDGHGYIPQALERGCRTVLVSHTDGGWYDDVMDMDVNIIKTDDTVYAMGQLAGYYLDSLDVIKVAVTGSVGKTTTRDMIYYALSEKYRCGKNLKNFNNDVGLPLSIFRFDSSMQAVVLEMGMDHFGEIDRLGEIVKPNVAVITNIGVSHIENLGSREGIFKAKMEIAGHITDHKAFKGALVFPWDEEFLTRERTRGDYDQIMIGENGRSDYIISDIDDFGLDGIQFTLEHMERSRRIDIKIAGRHNAVNASLAIAVSNILGLSADEAQRGLLKTELTGSRLRHVSGNGISIIDDTYNASPDSMKSALKVLEQSSCSGKKTAILGDMYELGTQSGRQHRGVGVFARGLKIDNVIAVGENAKDIAEGAGGGDINVMHFDEKEELYARLKELVHSGDIILVKGSRGMKMEQIVDKLLEI